MHASLCGMVVTLAAAASLSFASDPIVWDNGDIYFIDKEFSVWALAYGTANDEGLDQTVADDFILEQNTLITGLQWAGYTFSSPDAFIIEFYASDPEANGLPTGGTLDPSELALASYFIDIEDIVVTDEPNWPPNNDFHYAADLSAAFEADAGETYWVSIQGYFEGGGMYSHIQSEKQQLQIIAIPEHGQWINWPFSRKSYDGDLTFKLRGVPACPGDFVASASFEPPGDGSVDGADLAFLLGEWGAHPGSFADLVESATFAPPPDGVVDGADLAVLLGAWGGCS